MSHTTQRRGLDRSTKQKEIIVLAMLPTAYKKKSGARSAMKAVALKMLEYGPDNWLSRNFTDVTIPNLGKAQGLVMWMNRYWPDSAKRLLMTLVGYLSSVITAVYTDPKKVERLLADLKGSWLAGNREKEIPISIVLSGIEGDIHSCCRKNGLTEHTYLHSIGFYGRVKDLPTGDELSLVTMCGHGMVAVNYIRDLTGKIRGGEISAKDAAELLARPCVCGIVNRERAEEIFKKLASR
jgi:hypothetical protein